MLAMITGATGLVRGTLSLHQRSAAVTLSIRKTQADVQHELDRQEELTRRRDYLQSDRGVETESHPLGYGRETERRLMFDDEPPSSAQPGVD